MRVFYHEEADKADLGQRRTACISFQSTFYTPIQGLAVCGLLWFMAGCTPPKQNSDQPGGQKLYTAYCVSCHGAEGRNDRAGAVPAMRLNNANFLSAADWNQLILTGRGQMPAFQSRLSVAQLDALRAYVRQLTARP